MEERHKCKLCSRSFSNGRALGGHMKAHLTHSSSSDSEQEEKPLTYGLRENPKKSIRVDTPSLSLSLVQDRESETESKNPTRQRSKRNRKSTMVSLRTPPHPEPEPLSSVSDTSPEEDVAMSLIMLSRDTWNLHANAPPPHTSHIISPPLPTHKTNNNIKVFQCPFCYKVFRSGQALGGHKRSHLIPSSSSTLKDSVRLKQSFLDLNLPAPPEDDDLSVVSDA